MKRYVRLPLLAVALTLLLAATALAAGSRGEIGVIGSNGTVTAGVRLTDRLDRDTNMYERELVYTTDGVNWLLGETPEGFQFAHRGYYAGGKFWMGYRNYEGQYCQEYVSDDGVHWSKVDHDQPVADVPLGMAELGGYHFELGEGGSLWLSRTDNSGRAVELPAFREALKDMKLYQGDVKAYPGPNDTVVVEVGDLADGIYPVYTIAYPTSSLEWVLDNLADYRPIHLAQTTTDGAVTLGRRYVGNGWEDYRWHSDIVYSYDGLHYARVPDAPWGGSCELLPYNGRTFLVLDRDNTELYASTDGVHWQNLRGTYLRPALPENVNLWATVLVVRAQWTGREYITCQRVFESSHSIMGSAGGVWADPTNTRVCFADESFNLTGSYDFGRQVVGVGYYNGAWYAQVQEDENTAALYVSTDKTTWTRTDILQIMESVRTWS